MTARRRVIGEHWCDCTRNRQRDCEQLFPGCHASKRDKQRRTEDRGIRARAPNSGYTIGDVLVTMTMGRLRRATGDRRKVGWWWLSFADPNRPRGTQFLGVIVIEAAGFIDAVDKTHAANINPGGEVRGEPVEVHDIPEQYRNRLLTREETELFGVSTTT